MDRKTVLAFVIIGLILLAMPYYYDLITPDAPQETQTPLRDTAPSMLDTLIETPTVSPQVSAPSITLVDSLPVERESRDIVVETPLYRARFNTLGATVSSWTILPTQSYLEPHGQEEMVRFDRHRRNLVLVIQGNQGIIKTEDSLFVASRDSVILTDSDSSETLEFTMIVDENTWYREIYTFYADRYDFDVRIEGNGLTNYTGNGNAFFTWGDGLALTEVDESQDLFYTHAVYMVGNNTETFKENGKEFEEEFNTSSPRWVAQRTKYFVMAMVPDVPADGVYLAVHPDARFTDRDRPKIYETALQFDLMQPDFQKNINIYIGPLDQVLVSEVDPSLTRVMSWGWPIIRPFSIAVLWSLKFMHQYIPNYGVVLLIFSVLIKIIVWPLTHKSYVSTKRMQMLQPKLKAIQEKYKKNPQRSQQEVMALYKEHKVNPMGGCLPMLLQMPLLYALFIVFRTTIELRGAPFVLWINDLSMPDILFHLPFSIPMYGDHVALLPIVMAVSTFLQSRMTMTDPNQKPMLYMMPVMFIFLFNNFPSGLTLYYTLFNILSWLQQRIMKINDPGIEKELQQVKEEKEKQDRRNARKKGKSRNA